MVKVSDLVDVIRGVTYSKIDSSDIQFEGALPIFRANNIQGQSLIVSDLIYVNKKLISDIQIVKKNDIVIAMSSGSKALVGKAAQAHIDYEIAFGAFCGVLRPNKLVNPRYIGWFFSSAEYRNKVSELSAGANINNLKPSHFSEIDIPLIPLAEQQQIAQTLDKLLAQVDTLKTRLDAIPNILKRFRQSVLAAAVSGRLTEEWRGELNLNKFNSEVEELEVFRDQVLEPLPESWQWLRFEYVADIASNLQSPFEDPKAIHIAPNHIESGSGKLLEFKTVEEDNVTSAKHRFYSGQILYSKIRPYLCKVAIAKFTGLCSADMYPVNPKIETNYLFRWMLSSRFTEWASNAESRSVLPKINQNDLNKIPVPTPPLKEQTEIVRRVEQLFAYADYIEQRVKDAQARVNHLTQSILAKAFRGELTAEWRAQNPALISGENSAAALLARIKAEREATAKPRRSLKR